MNRLKTIFRSLAILVVVCTITKANGEGIWKRGLSQENDLEGRVVKLKGAHNFRDVGGLKNKDGRLVKTGLLYRSDKLTDLSDGDLVKLEMLSVNLVLDLRSIHEINLKADRMPRGARFLHRQIGHEAVDPVEFTRDLLSGKWTGHEFQQYMKDGNSKMVIEGKSVFPLIIRDIISNKEGATVFHCAGGKDRTGVVTALILSILDVPREVIFQDYLYTNIQRKDEFVEKFSKLKKVTNNSIKNDLLVAMKAHKAYLKSAFDTIDNEFGGVDKYVKSYLGITEKEIQLLREKMLK
jgi:protein-tyrosine phosphatase